MVITWVTTKAQQFLVAEDAELDALSVNFDFALSAEMLDLLYQQKAAAQLPQVTKSAVVIPVTLDEHELALAI
ncbi:MAG: hypothetical protein RIQ94_708 [Pseudomonadota bacterium]|jgi:phage terminase Nu1 subunit (DNA packaging protein)